MSNGGVELGAVAPSAARSPQQMRDVNVAIVLDLFWDSTEGAAFTASEIIDHTGLTRATVLAICSDLREIGWLVEDRAPTAVPGRGRQARRFALNAQRKFVVAADVGLNSVTVVVADARGTVLARVRRRNEDMPHAEDKTAQLMECIVDVLERANVDAANVGAACLGVAASVDRNGEPLPGDPFWQKFRIDLPRLAAVAPWRTLIENDADLAAIAENAFDLEGADPLVALLSSDRFGAGIMIRGELMRGAHGAAGEMAYLELVDGVANPFGLSLTARVRIDAALAAGRVTVIPARGPGAEETALEDALAAAEKGDELAVEIIAELVERLAITVSTFSQFIDPGKVVISGGVAGAVDALLPAVRSRLSELLPVTPDVVPSTLGRDVVLVGAVHGAIGHLRATALAEQPPTS